MVERRRKKIVLSKLSTLNRTNIAVQGKFNTDKKLIPFIHKIAFIAVFINIE